MSQTPKRLRCAMFPSPYTDTAWMSSNHPLLLKMAQELSKLGCDCLHTPEFPSLGWLIANRGKMDVIHLHWPEHYYFPIRHSMLSRLIGKIMGRLHLSHLLRLVDLAWLFVFLTLTRLLKIPVFWTIHDLYPHDIDNSRSQQYERIARSFLMRNISTLILNARSAESLVTAQFGMPRRIVIAPLGNYRKFYPDTVSTKEARDAMGVAPDERVFLYFGSMKRHRNALGVIHAFRNMREKNLRLFVIGGCSEALRQETEKAAWGDWRIRCLFQIVPNDEIEFLVKASDFVIMPGHRYLTSAVILLALSFGRPVIAPRYGCAVDMVGGAGILYEDQDPKGLENAMREAVLVDMEKYKRLAEKQSESFSWALTAARMFEAYTKNQKNEAHESALDARSA